MDDEKESIIKYRKFDFQEMIFKGYGDLEDAELMLMDLDYDDMSIEDLRDWVDDVFCYEGDEHIEGASMTEAELIECLIACDYWLIKI